MATINEKLAKLFDELAVQFKSEHYRSRAYRNAASAIREYPTEILSGSQAQRDIKGIGKGIATKIDEIIATGVLQIIEKRPQEEKDRDRVLELFQGIHGVGIVTAEKWFDMGFRSLEDLCSYYYDMTDAQKLGYYYYNHLKLRIPRNEMDQISNIIASALSGVTYQICGSYRRGEADSGDIDCLIKGDIDVDLSRVLKRLVDTGVIVGHLAHGESKYMGLIRLAENYNVRRIDLMIVDPKSWPYATLYFTGSKKLNVYMRAQALKMGLSMNEYGITDTENNDNARYVVDTEQEIFSLLGLDYIEPTSRSI